MPSDFDRKMMLKAIELSRKNIEKGGGPFGAIIVRDGQIVARAGNSVTISNDPTAHAEINAIRKACRKLGTFDLSGCTIYTSCEPCPMCLGAIYWAHIDKIFYGNDAKAAAAAGFDDNFIYKELSLLPEYRSIPTEPLHGDDAFKVFEIWINKPDKTRY